MTILELVKFKLLYHKILMLNNLGIATFVFNKNGQIEHPKNHRKFI